MLPSSVILIVLTVVAVYGLLSRRIESSIVTLPMIFVGLGLVLSQMGLPLLSAETGRSVIHTFAEITLIVVLFADASRVNWTTLFAHSGVPARMLVVGMPLAILLGTLIAHWVSPDQPWALAFLTAAILTPTDAALGQAVVTSADVPKPLRQSINVESGLNDGLALPVVLIAAIVVSGGAAVSGESVPDNIALFTLKQVVIGPLAGALIGLTGAKLLDIAVRRSLATDVSQGLYFLAIAFLAFFGAEAVGGNGFIAAFIAGLVFGNVLHAPTTFIREFMEGEGQLLTMLTFLIFGAVLAPVGIEHASVKTVILAALFLTVVRIGAIWLSLLGSGLRAGEKLFLGWFGPRGLASILFALLVLEQFEFPGADEMVACVVLTVLLSIVLHGVTATPLSHLFAAKDATTNR